MIAGTAKQCDDDLSDDICVNEKTDNNDDDVLI